MKAETVEYVVRLEITLAERDAEIARLRSDNATLRADAERYRFIRSEGWAWLKIWADEDGCWEIDKVIDKRRGENHDRHLPRMR